MPSRRAQRAAATMLDQYWQPTGLCGLITRTALRTSQFIFAVIAAALYGADLAHSSTTTSTSSPTNWIYAEVCAGLSAITCIVHCFATVTNVAWCVWDFVVCVLWAAAFGVFGSIFIGAKKEDSVDDEWDLTMDVERMRVALGVDAVCMVLWFATAVMGCAWCCRARRVKRRKDKLLDGEGSEEVEIGGVAGRV
ncbi:hypothetical protein B0J12DRAFT_390325 [Macrophomina phaseolina]|uniref:MARVEL domain-containing protein n=1 Tax=Macrophomina phaseolina TaxID=35725 RepID=A0ABQ8FT48_9PEZI|nr:hypothetical protein B0J12DRAFT_390325 [Macrophomina phaseolina]